jgi:hypothetical protein
MNVFVIEGTQAQHECNQIEITHSTKPPHALRLIGFENGIYFGVTRFHLFEDDEIDCHKRKKDKRWQAIVVGQDQRCTDRSTYQIDNQDKRHPSHGADYKSIATTS